jgi:hypothetical protein
MNMIERQFRTLEKNDKAHALVPTIPNMFLDFAVPIILSRGNSGKLKSGE